jgi:hypothetical protein
MLNELLAEPENPGVTRLMAALDNEELGGQP